MKIRDDNEEGTKQLIPPLDLNFCGLNYSCEFHQLLQINFPEKSHTFEF